MSDVSIFFFFFVFVLFCFVFVLFWFLVFFLFIFIIIIFFPISMLGFLFLGSIPLLTHSSLLFFPALAIFQQKYLLVSSEYCFFVHFNMHLCSITMETWLRISFLLTYKLTVKLFTLFVESGLGQHAIGFLKLCLAILSRLVLSGLSACFQLER